MIRIRIRQLKYLPYALRQAFVQGVFIHYNTHDEESHQGAGAEQSSYFYFAQVILHDVDARV